ncbi:salt tolerance down-regulator-domain-containing protein [Pilobolus umbonatus]|nr:salt tolerance down-regulator-domain-containing protein [Pilobolus umbonatus]
MTKSLQLSPKVTPQRPTIPIPMTDIESTCIASIVSKKKRKHKKKLKVINSIHNFNSQSQAYMVDAMMNHHVIRHGDQLDNSSNSLPKKKSTKGEDEDNFWSSTNNTEERQKIREFWSQLGEDERRSLVKVEKEAVLRKMKEQQKHSCNCSVCGKKRTAIEDELEVLYDAYYEELEQLANEEQQKGTMSLNVDYGSTDPVYEGVYEDADQLDEDAEEEDDDEEENEDEDEEDELEEDEYEEEDEEEDDYDETNDDLITRFNSSYSERTRFEEMSHIRHNSLSRPSGNGDHFSFGNSLTVKGILTVADDLLKNDGKKFLDMMERLAERRMQKEDITIEPNSNVFQKEDEDEVFEDEDEDNTSDEQRMHEGRKMFQIFAARMFEQRVLAAYKEKVARERQQRLLEELEEEERLREEREAKKQKEREKKRDKKRQLKKQQEEERLMVEAVIKAEQEALKREKEKKLEMERLKKEKERLKKEEEKRLREEERLKKEEEKRRRTKEEKEKAAEKERRRKAKEEKERLEKEKEKLEKEKTAEKEKRRRAKEEREKLEKEKDRLEKEKVRLLLERERLLKAKAMEDKTVKADKSTNKQVKSPDQQASVVGKPGNSVSKPENSVSQPENSVNTLEKEDYKLRRRSSTQEMTAEKTTQPKSPSPSPVRPDSIFPLSPIPPPSNFIPHADSVNIPETIEHPEKRQQVLMDALVGNSRLPFANGIPSSIRPPPHPTHSPHHVLHLDMPKGVHHPLLPTAVDHPPLADPSSSIIGIFNRIHPESNLSPRRTMAPISPIGQPVNGRRASAIPTSTLGSAPVRSPSNQEATVDPYSHSKRPSTVDPETGARSFFSNFLFGEPSRGNAGTIPLMPPHDYDMRFALQPRNDNYFNRRFSMDGSGSMNWSNGKQ